MKRRLWWIGVLFMVGSVFFGIAAVASWVIPDTGELLNTKATNAFTFLGAVCFFAGAWRMSRYAAPRSEAETSERRVTGVDRARRW